MSEPNTNLYKCLSGLLSGLTCVNKNFVEYDDNLVDLLLKLGQMNMSPADERMSYSTRTITDLTGSGPFSLALDFIYRITITEDTTFILPNISDVSLMHEILITVKFNHGNNYPLYVTFKDSQNNTIEPMDINDWDDGDVVEYLCRYESLLGKWCIMPMKMS